jgi:superoxide dismutase, Cu-Zn family
MKILRAYTWILLWVGTCAFGQQTSDSSATTSQAQSGNVDKKQISAFARLLPTGGNTARGTVSFTKLQVGNAVAIQVNLSSLEPFSVHGIHLHEVGDCSAKDGSSAGGHFNPDAKRHGDRAGEERHRGDLGNIFADAFGNALTTFDVAGLEIADGPAVIVGRSVIVHANRDDTNSQPAGNSGARISCGVIESAGSLP